MFSKLLPLLALVLGAYGETVSPPAAETVKVAAIQCSSNFGDVPGNTRKLTALIKEAAAQGAQIIVTPEMCITGYLSQDMKKNWHIDRWPIAKGFWGVDPKNGAEEVTGTSVRHFRELAAELKVYLTIPFLEVDYTQGPEKPRYFNTVCLANPKGELAAHYRKLTPWPHPEKSWATPGDLGIQCYDTEYGRVGLAICYDIHTILDKYQDSHLWALLYPIAWVDGEHPADWFYAQLPDRIRRYKHHLIGANWSVDQRQAWRGYGFSPIISSQGRVVAAAKTLYESEIIYAELPTQVTPSAAR